LCVIISAYQAEAVAHDRYVDYLAISGTGPTWNAGALERKHVAADRRVGEGRVNDEVAV